MDVMCLDLEGVLLPEIWKGVAHKTGIKELELTTRNIPDYNELMSNRLRIMNQNQLDLSVLQEVVSQLEPLAGAKDFLDWLRTEFQVIILSDTFYEFAKPLIAQLGWPTLFCHHLEVGNDNKISGYRLRMEDHKRMAVQSLQKLNFNVKAAGDSYNDISMLKAANEGYLFNAPSSIIKEFPKFPTFNNYNELKYYLKN
ncbi:MAG: Phosphoserine phosphatase ThrH [Alphaproteobacteria bacterium MarineAlpha3_Bin7]|nr:MAG: Phosphoserine phosphatase ThrH [Alphaproteobacteria bacterium MarineAlpha3_Bin7]